MADFAVICSELPSSLYTPLPSLAESRQLIQVDDCDEMMIGQEVSRESQHGI